MINDVAVFLDLDNLVIGAKQAHLPFDINLILDHIRKITNGRIVLREAYGVGHQSQDLIRELTRAGFTTHTAARISNYSKNLADMQIVVNAMDTLIDGHQYGTYVLMSGDRDFTPLVQSLRKRGKHVIGVGIRNTTSGSLAELCDEYIFYEDLIPSARLTPADVEDLLARAMDEALRGKKRVRASILKQAMIELSRGRFGKADYPESNFRRFLSRYPNLVQIQQENSTTYVLKPQSGSNTAVALHLRYRSQLKRQNLRVVSPKKRFRVLKDMIRILQKEQDVRWRQLLDMLFDKYANIPELEISRNIINAVLLLARRAQIIRTLKGRSLSTAPVLLDIDSDRPFQDAVIRTDSVYLQEILALPEPFDLHEVALALYEKPEYADYLQRLMNSLDATAAS